MGEGEEGRGEGAEKERERRGKEETRSRRTKERLWVERESVNYNELFKYRE